MAKLTKYNSFESLKSSDTKVINSKAFIQLPELKDFLSTLQKKISKTVKTSKT